VVWLSAAVPFALGVVAAPILIHLLVQRRAEQLAFPTLRFLRPTRLASIRRHVLDDLPLLIVRCAILAAAVAALAGPLIVTAARRSSWNQRIIRAVVSTSDGARVQPGEPVFRTQQFSRPSLRDGIQHAMAWFDTAPPARRELVVTSTFPIGSIAAADLAAVPADIGIRLERTGVLPPTRTVGFGALLDSAGGIARDVTLAGAATTVQERSIAGGAPTRAWAVDVIAPAAAHASVDAAVAAVRSQRVWAPAAGRKARLVVLEGAGSDPARTTASALENVGSIQTPWVADAIARAAGDADLHAAARRVLRGIADARFAGPPWRPVARAADGTPLVVAASSAGRLVVASGAPASDIATPILVRAIANALADVPNLQRDEVVSIGDDDLRVWSRPPRPPSAMRLRNVDEDDRRWFWVAALALMALESWMRRAGRSAVETGGNEAQRVA
jgi:aerotolerance regulator-like protein